MLTMMMPMLMSLWNKTWKYVTIAAAVLVAVLAIYWKGKQDERTEVERRVLGADLENRRQGETIRGTVDIVPDPVERLRRDWTRPRD